jgi:DNA-binding CsgD family transcriptional regulator
MLLGRTEECARIEQLLSDARGGTSGAAVVVGEPGIGKTALLNYAVDRAEGMAVLSARGIELEAEVAFSGLLELLRPIIHLVDDIPGPQAAALRGALALGPAAETDRFNVGAATLSILAARAEEEPLLVVVDDAHWLDDSSAAALMFAARRFVADPIVILLACRAGSNPVLETAALPQLTLNGLGREAAAALVERHARRAVPAGITDRLFRATAGNPLALVELAAQTPRLGVDFPEGQVPLETSVERAFLRRADELSVEARRLLVVAAAVDSGDLGTIKDVAARLALNPQALEEAESADLVRIRDVALEFRHPLFRSAVYHACEPGQRRAVHGAIAAALTNDRDADRRAWHLAAASFGPDEGVARDMEQAASRARSRSAYAASASAAERAAHLSPEPEARARRLLLAADGAWLAGDAERTLALLDDLLQIVSDETLRADALRLRGHAVMRTGPAMDGHDILVDAASRVAEADPSRAVIMRAEAADACVYSGRPETMLETARNAWEALSNKAGDREKVFAHLALGTALIYNGRGAEGTEHVRTAIDIIDRSDVLGEDPHLLSWAALGPLWLREVEAGRRLFGRAIDAARAQGTVGALPFSLWVAARDAATSDRWAVAEAQYNEAIRIAQETGQTEQRCASLAGLACVEARRGKEEDCRTHAGEALSLSERLGLAFFRVWCLGALADLELGMGRPAEALKHLEQKEDALSEVHIADPDISSAPELVEVYVRSGRDSDARKVATQYIKRAEEKGQPWALARAARCRGLLAGDGTVERRFAEALEYHALTPDTYEEARTRLCLGEKLRRAKRRVQAREQLRVALAHFDELGAEPWAERSRAELLATGERARRRDESTIYALTPQEVQVAMVLSEGKTTREAAAQLFLSPKTIEYHLRNSYRKLGINSRDALFEILRAEGKE